MFLTNPPPVACRALLPSWAQRLEVKRWSKADLSSVPLVEFSTPYFVRPELIEQPASSRTSLTSRVMKILSRLGGRMTPGGRRRVVACGQNLTHTPQPSQFHSVTLPLGPSQGLVALWDTEGMFWQAVPQEQLQAGSYYQHSNPHSFYASTNTSSQSWATSTAQSVRHAVGQASYGPHDVSSLTQASPTWSAVETFALGPN